MIGAGSGARRAAGTNAKATRRANAVATSQRRNRICAPRLFPLRRAYVRPRSRPGLGAHARMLRCYQAAAGGLTPLVERIDPFEGGTLPANLRRPIGRELAPVAIILPGLDACKEGLRAWSDAFVRRGMATLLDGPGQGGAAFRLPVRAE